MTPEELGGSAATRCRHCHEVIESYNGYDYVARGVSWRHEKTREVYCRTTTAEPEKAAASASRGCGDPLPPLLNGWDSGWMG